MQRFTSEGSGASAPRAFHRTNVSPRQVMTVVTAVPVGEGLPVGKTLFFAARFFAPPPAVSHNRGRSKWIDRWLPPPRRTASRQRIALVTAACSRSWIRGSRAALAGLVVVFLAPAFRIPSYARG